MTPPPPASLPAERRVVTILFADLAGFTHLSEQADPEEARSLLNACFDRLAPVIEQFGGTIDKFVGDEIMALFGAPAAHEDDAERALHTALEMMAALAAFNAENHTALGLHVGINTGLVVAGGIGSQGRQAYSVIGDAANVAHRIQSLSEAGDILLGEETHHLSAARFDFEPRGEAPIRGRSEPVKIYRLIGPKAQPSPMRGLLGLSSPMVGRETEMASLLGLSRSLRTDKGGVVFVLGDPGLGKSRLVNEWQATAQSHYPEIRWAGEHCLSYGQGLAYRLATDLVRALAEVHPGDPESKLAEAVQKLARNGSVEPDDYTCTYLSHLLSLPLEASTLATISQLDPQVLQERYVEALRRVLTSLTAKQPLTLVLEDFHWADPSSVGLATRLLPLANEAPVLFCFVVRPDADAPAWALVSTVRDNPAPERIELMLPPLSEAESQRLVTNLLEGESLSAPVRSLILKRAEGNPFFIEEIIRILIDRGVIFRKAGGWISLDDTQEIEIPATLQGLLMARVDRLPDAARQILRVATVIGRRFSRRVLDVVLKGAGETPVETLDELERAGILQSVEPEPEAEYRFRHTLVYEAAYQSILRQDRKRLHLAVGEVLETFYASQQEERAVTLAYHFDAAEDFPRALRYNTLAGDVAFRKFALPEAIGLYSRALEIVKRAAGIASPKMLRHLYLQRGRAFELSAQFKQALENYSEMAAAGKSLDNLAIELAALTEHAKLHATPTTVADSEEGQHLANRALQLAQQAGDRAAQARLHWILLLALRWQGEFEAAIEHGQQSLALSRELDLREQLAYTLQDIHPYYSRIGDYDRAMALLEEARQLWRELGNFPMLADNLNSAGDIMHDSGKSEQALALADEAYRLSEAIGNRWNQAFAMDIRGLACFELGRFDESIEAFGNALRLSEQAGLVALFSRTVVRAVLAIASLGAGEHFSALTRLIEAASARISIMWPEAIRLAQRVAAARLAVYQQQLEKASEILDEASQTILGFSTDFFALHGWLYLVRCELAAARRDPSGVVALADEVLDSDQTMFHRCRIELLAVKGRALLDMGDLISAEALLRSAWERAEAGNLRCCFVPIQSAMSNYYARCGDSHQSRLWHEAGRQSAEETLRQTNDAELRQGYLNWPGVREVIGDG